MLLPSFPSFPFNPLVPLIPSLPFSPLSITASSSLLKVLGFGERLAFKLSRLQAENKIIQGRRVITSIFFNIFIVVAPLN